MFLAATVRNQNRSRDNRCRSYPVALLNNRLHVVCRKHLEGGALRGVGDGMGVFPHIERAVGSLLVPVFGFTVSALVLGEAFPFWKLAAFALVLGGLAFNLLWPRLRT